MDSKKNKDYIFKEFDENAIPAIQDYVRIPNLSRNYDAEWESNGLLEKAAHFLQDWAEAQKVTGLKSQFL